MLDRRLEPRPPMRTLAILLALLPLGACNTVEYYEKRAFSDAVMEFEDGATETHWFQKVYYSIEGSAGGIGTSAGGGCGCY
jgi:Domain of unknown function (DUF4266)